MKKIFNIFLLATLSLIFVTGCSDDKYEVVDPVANMVKIVSRETTLPASASQGKVVVDATSPVTVTSTADGWLTTTVEGNTILINVDFNSSLESRSATLTIKSGTKESQVAVIQEGVIVNFDLGEATSIKFSSDAQTVEYPVSSNCDVEFSTDVDWINIAEAESRASNEKVILISLDENPNGPRSGNIVYKAGLREGYIPVDQDMSILGEYELRYYTGSSKATSAKKSCVISKTESGYICTVELSSSESYEVPLTYDAEKSTLAIYNATQVGTYNDKDAFSMILGPKTDGTGTYNTTNASVNISGDIVYDKEDGAVICEFLDNGSWSGYIARAVYIRTYNTNPPSGSVVSTRVQFWYPTLYKADK
ncbi:MAG: hypothetical protein K2H59_10065 [Muribaculaceae bacterium]|nr:hypothetical protein [Muribaculaceae bacterium]